MTSFFACQKENQPALTSDAKKAPVVTSSCDNYNVGLVADTERNTSICLFGKTINESSGAPGQPSRTVLLSTLFQHEFGHLSGVVNQGSPSQLSHIDSSNGAHCKNSSCLMFYDVETAIGSFLNGIPALDAGCRGKINPGV